MKSVKRSAIALCLILGCYGFSSPQIAHDNISYNVFTTSAESLTFLWKNPETEKPFLTVENVCKFYKKVGKSVHFITNGGIYDKGYKPTGFI